MPIDLSQLASATPTLVLAVAIIVSLLKPLLEQTVLPPASPLHDTVIRLTAILTGAVVAVVASIATLPPHAIATIALVLTAIIGGATAGLGAVVTFHLLTSSYFATDETAPFVAVPVVPMPSLPVQRVELTHIVAPVAPIPASGASPADNPPPPALIVPPSTSATSAVAVQASNGGASAAEVPAPVATP